MNLIVHLVEPNDAPFLTMLKPHLHPEVTLFTEADRARAAEAQVIVIGVPKKHDVDGRPSLHTLIIPWSGLPKATRKLMLEYPQIAVHNLHHNATAVAEAALTLMLCVAKRVLPHDRQLRQGDWRPRYLEPRMPLLADRSALILGYGAIGRRIAAHCRALGMQVRALRRTGSHGAQDGVEVYPPTELHRLLPGAHVLFVALPLTPETDGMIGAEELDLLPAEAILVNVARGAIVDEVALYHALVSGRISAGLDVWYRYPDSAESRSHTLPSGFPFAGLDNVVMTPHLAEHTSETEPYRARALARLLNAAAVGESLPNRVDLTRGY
jgi:phosphoglycerate dehydrogenase-like enzyme